jgi:hypothetical protein
MCIKDELAMLWDKLDVMAKYPVSLQAARPDDAEGDAESEEEDVSDDADDQVQPPRLEINMMTGSDDWPCCVQWGFSMEGNAALAVCPSPSSRVKCSY